MSDNHEPSFNYGHVRDAMIYAIKKKDYDPINFILERDIGSFVQIQHRQTPIFMAVNEVLGNSLLLPKEERPHALDLVLNALEHIFNKADKKLGNDPDKELLNAFIHASCNHISPSSMLESGGTVRDIMEHYAGVEVTKRPGDKAYMNLYKLVHEYGLDQKKTVIQERIKTTAPSENGR